MEFDTQYSPAECSICHKKEFHFASSKTITKRCTRCFGHAIEVLEHEIAARENLSPVVTSAFDPSLVAIKYAACYRCGSHVAKDRSIPCDNCVRELIDTLAATQKRLHESLVSLRDKFACYIISGVIAAGHDSVECQTSQRIVAEIAYAIADDMLAEREKGARP